MTQYEVDDQITATITGRVVDIGAYDSCLQVRDNSGYYHYIYSDSTAVKIERKLRPHPGEVYKVSQKSGVVGINDEKWLCVRYPIGGIRMISASGNNYTLEDFEKEFAGRYRMCLA